VKLLVGIGNPGAKYDGTRHNVGFAVADLVRERRSGAAWREEPYLKAAFSKLGETALVLKPSTFVNVTGESVREAARRYLSAAQDFLFVCDDVNLEFGKLRLRDSGSAGGHHGLESAIEGLGSTEFARLRVGVKNERMPRELSGFVLERFQEEELAEIPKILEKAASVCEAWLEEGFQAATNRLSQLQSVK
jgi:PTH1 family peptidyl-tRNA hydrolase